MTAIRKREQFPVKKMIYGPHSIHCMACSKSNGILGELASLIYVISNDNYETGKKLLVFDCEGIQKLNIDHFSPNFNLRTA